MSYKQKVCEECGKLFTPRGGGQRYCDGPHVAVCLNCGKGFEYACSPKEKPMYCSKECREAGKKKSNLLKYGVANVSQIPEVSSKISKIKSGEIKKATYQPVVTYKKCEWCGKEFKANGTQRFCNGPHYSTCVVCGKKFRVDPVQPKKTCSTNCAAKLRKQHIQEVDHICEICGKHFKSSSNTARYCDGPHYRPCPICGKPVQFYSNSDPVKCCSDDCTKELRRRTSISTYGVAVPSKSADVKQKLRFKSLISADKRADTCMKKYGYSNPAMSPDVKAKISSTVSSSECQNRIAETNLSKYGVRHTSQLPEIHSKAYTSRSSVFAIDGTPVDSLYEKQVYDFCLLCNVPFEYQSRTISYEYNGQQHTTIVDFVIDGYLVEVKGSHILGGCFDKLGVPITKKLEVYRNNHVIVVTDAAGRCYFGKPNSSTSNGLKYLNKCPNPLIGVDISLFTNNLEFPYRADRPPCFYDVRVDGQKSIHEAFFDGQLRWKMIKNRIEYSGGFIDAKQVLTAFNVTRTCKQPSWFSKSLAKDLISKYCTSDVIVDPFAGYGARADAAHELNKKYIGIDFNKSLVEWHHEQDRDCISWGDANEFRYDGDCSVFICPPYSDPETGRCFEDYNFEGFDDAAKAKSQCDWLKIVMKNVPNAREYVMVCKIVDSGWEQFIIDTKNNRSHFGPNNEYVIRVSRDNKDELLNR